MYDIIVVMGELNEKVGAVRTTLEHVLGNQGIAIRNDNGGRFVDFCNTNHLVIGGTVFQHKPCYKISCGSSNGGRVFLRLKKCDKEARRASTYFTDRLKCPTFLTNFSVTALSLNKVLTADIEASLLELTTRKKIVHHATCLATPQSVSLAQK